jgi:hypothetical protein
MARNQLHICLIISRMALRKDALIISLSTNLAETNRIAFLGWVTRQGYYYGIAYCANPELYYVIQESHKFVQISSQEIKFIPSKIRKAMKEVLITKKNIPLASLGEWDY